MNIQIIKDIDNTYDKQITNVIKSAFNQDTEALLVSSIKEHSNYYISYVALDNELVIGHVMISPMCLNNIENILCLAPVSVLEEYNNQGIGGLLIKNALKEACANEEYKLISVLGSDHYYKRFGFEAYNPNKFTLPFQIQPRFFQLLEIEKGCLEKLNGDFTYPSYFELD